VIESVYVENLRGIRSCRIEGLTNLNVFIGRNGAGKSTILEVIYLASSWSNRYDFLRSSSKTDYVVRRRCGRGDWNTYRDTLWFVKSIEEEITIELKFKSLNTLRFKILYEPLLESSIFLELPEEVVGKTCPNCPRKPLYLTPSSNYLLDPKTRSSYYVGPNYFDEVVLKLFNDELKYLRDVVFLDSRLTVGDVEERVWKSLLDRRLDKLVVDLVREEFEPNVESIGFKPTTKGGFVLALWLPNTSVEVDALGDGARIAIFYASTLALIKDTGVLIEDPEIHQHPGGLMSLMKFVLRVAKERNLQLFITTHSIELINIVRLLSKEFNLNMKVFYMERDHSSGVVDVRALEDIDVKVLQEIGLDPRLLHVV